MRNNLSHYAKYLLIFLFTVIFITTGKTQGVLEHLEYLAHEVTYNKDYRPPSTLTEWEKKREEIRIKLLKTINLYPFPEKTPLNIKFVGDRIDLGNCYFQRVVYESRPKIYVAAHLFIPKNVKFPVPAVIHVPGHSRRDAYRPHARTYAANGFVAIELPMVGEEGKTGAGWGKCGEYGAYVGHFNMFNTGYSSIGPTVWDGIRTVDFLLTLTNDNGTKLVDPGKIGMAGLSGGSARTLWTVAAEPRISCAVVNEGYSAIEGYNKLNKGRGGIRSTCDIHLIYNFFRLPVASFYSLIAPRPFLVQLGTLDDLYPNPQPVTDYLKKIYKLYNKPEYFSEKYWEQGHGYSKNIWNAEHEWMDKWLRKGDSPLKIYEERFEAPLTCFPDGEPSDMKNTEKVYTVKTPVWNIETKSDYKIMKDALMPKMREEIMPAAFKAINCKLKSETIEKTKKYVIEKTELSIDDNSIIHNGYFFFKPKKAKKTVIYILTENSTLAELKQKYENDFLNNDINLFCTYVTGYGSNPWEDGVGFVFDRFAMLTGFTRASLRVTDILAAVNQISKKRAAKHTGIYIWGRGELAVPALYSAVADNNIAGVILENAQDKHIGITPEKETKCPTAMFNILKYADIPQVASLVCPRKIILAGEHKKGYDETEKIYSLMGEKDKFIKTGNKTSEVLKAL